MLNKASNHSNYSVAFQQVGTRVPVCLDNVIQMFDTLLSIYNTNYNLILASTPDIIYKNWKMLKPE